MEGGGNGGREGGGAITMRPSPHHCCHPNHHPRWSGRKTPFVRAVTEGQGPNALLAERSAPPLLDMNELASIIKRRGLWPAKISAGNNTCSRTYLSGRIRRRPHSRCAGRLSPWR